MANWKETEIIGVRLIEGKEIELRFTSYVFYPNWIGGSVIFYDRYPFNTFQAGDEVAFDIDKLILHSQRYGENTLINDESVIKLVRCRLQETMALISRNSNELNMVRDERNNLRSENSDLHREIKDLISAGEKQLATKDEQIKQANNQLVRVQNDRDDYKNKWVLSGNEVKRITDSFNDLQLENNKKDEEIRKQKDKIKELKGELDISREEFLNQKIGLKEEKLETFIQQLGANRGKVMSLLNIYKQLLRERSNFNQTNIDLAENGINDIKQELLANGIIYRGISVANTQKICSKCEKLAKLKLELNQIYQEQQYQAHQGQPTNN